MRSALLLFVFACRSPEQQPAPAPVESVVASAAPSATIAPLASDVVVDGTGKLTIDASKIDKEAERRARLQRELASQELQILAVLGSPSDGGGTPSILSRGDVPSIDLSEALTRSYDAGRNSGGGGGALRGGGLADLNTTRDR